MNRRIRTLMALAFLPALVGLLQFGPFAGPSQAGAGGASKIHPQVWAEVQGGSETPVIINLVPPPEPLSDLTLDQIEEHAAQKQASVLASLAPADFTLTYQYEGLPALAGRITKDGVVALGGHPDVAGIAPDGEVLASLEEGVPLIHADQVHPQSVGTGITAAVLDTGIATGHPDLADNIVGEACFLSVCPPPPHVAEDDNGHGSHVSGIITSNGDNGIAARGVAPNAGIFAYKVLSASGGGSFSAILGALDDVAFQHSAEFEFINMSLGDGGSYGPGQCPIGNPLTAQHAISFSLRVNREILGTIPVAASGNNGSKSGVGFPACDLSVVSVGAVYDADLGARTCDATTAPDKAVCFSQSSSELDLLAPGSEIRSTVPGGDGLKSGTSMASPGAVAVGALLLQARPDLNPTTKPLGQRAAAADALVARLRSTGTLVVDQFTDTNPATFRTTPRIDARVALLTDDAADFDQDGCSNGKEFGGSVAQGGQRNPLYFWDFMGQWTGAPFARDRIVAVGDIGAVVNRFGTNSEPPLSKDAALAQALTPPAAATGYHASADRNGSAPGANAWNLLPPNGAISVGDIGAVVAQFGHSCV